MNSTHDLTRLSEPFEAGDIEWRVSRAGISRNGERYCYVLAYITARAIQQRLDEVVGPENWRNQGLRVHELRTGPVAMETGISIRIADQWVTKWDVSEPTRIEPAKGGFSGAMKRAGAQWGIGRYLYHLSETRAETSEHSGKGWHWAVMPEKHGGGSYYWLPPELPAWALPKDSDVTAADLITLKKLWRDKAAAGSTNPADLLDGFLRYVSGTCGEFPATDHKCWTREAYEKCVNGLGNLAANGVSGEVPFE